jgi:hypothetical protein
MKKNTSYIFRLIGWVITICSLIAFIVGVSLLIRDMNKYNDYIETSYTYTNKFFNASYRCENIGCDNKMCTNSPNLESCGSMLERYSQQYDLMLCVDDPSYCAPILSLCSGGYICCKEEFDIVHECYLYNNSDISVVTCGENKLNHKCTLSTELNRCEISCVENFIAGLQISYVANNLIINSIQTHQCGSDYLCVEKFHNQFAIGVNYPAYYMVNDPYTLYTTHYLPTSSILLVIIFGLFLIIGSIFMIIGYKYKSSVIDYDRL